MLQDETLKKLTFVIQLVTIAIYIKIIRDLIRK